MGDPTAGGIYILIDTSWLAITDMGKPSQSERHDEKLASSIRFPFPSARAIRLRRHQGAQGARTTCSHAATCDSLGPASLRDAGLGHLSRRSRHVGKNVDWDEYLIRVQNLGDDSLQLTNITVVDSLGTRMEPRQNRSQLVKGTKETKRRYKGEGLKVKAGLSGGVLVGAGVVAAAGTSGVGAAAVAGGGGGRGCGRTGTGACSWRHRSRSK